MRRLRIFYLITYNQLHKILCHPGSKKLENIFNEIDDFYVENLRYVHRKRV